MEYDAFFNWINERHMIYVRRKRGDPFPWTDDPILTNYRFCNVFRELDTVTIWLRKNWREPYVFHPNLWFMMAMARVINWPGTLNDITEETGFPDEFNPKDILGVFERRRSAGKKLFGGAYIITNGGSRLPKERYVVEECLSPLWDRGPDWELDFAQANYPARLEEAWLWFRKSTGFGPFIAYEVVTDLRHTRYLRAAPDITTWANAGPGALRGLNRLLYKPVDAPLKPKDALAYMQHLLAVANGPDSPLGPHVPRPLEMRDIEHSLCETDKYLRVLNGEGTPRAKYVYGRKA
jgi:hypothetical protein